jgi:hypothetical protein
MAEILFLKDWSFSLCPEDVRLQELVREYGETLTKQITRIFNFSVCLAGLIYVRQVH